MSRVHLFEIEDLSWCPEFIRETTTDILLGIYNLLHIYDPAFAKIATLVDKLELDAIIDCCSGSGGPIRQLREYLDKSNKKDVIITVTDKYPNLAVFDNLEQLFPKRIIGKTSSIDASRLPSSLSGLRTFFSSFHHFNPQQAVNILQDAANNNAPIAIFETTQRHPVDFIKVLLSPLLSLVFLPFAKRLTWKKFLLTYLVPITPFTFMWDYMVSNLRTYSSAELEELISHVRAPDYIWEVGKLWSPRAKSHVPYLIGYHRKQVV